MTTAPAKPATPSILLPSILLTGLAMVAASGALVAHSRAPRTDPAPTGLTNLDLSWRTGATLADALLPLALEPGFRAELIAAEPLIEAPVWIQFDEHARMWVVEMVGYMRDADGAGENEPSGRIAILEDTDGDGAMDTRTTFADGLVMPRAVLPCFQDARGPGALVIEPPNLIYLKDTNNDGRADLRRVILTGFEGENPEHAPNALTWGLDNWIHLSQHSLEFRFSGPPTYDAITRPTPPHGQWGLAMDRVGRLFYTPNSEALRMDLVPKHYALRNPAQRGFPMMGVLVCNDQTVWPIRPTPGVNRGYMDGILRADKRLAVHTAACGTTIYEASLLGPDYRGNAFVAEPAGNLVRRLIVEPTGDRVRAVPAYTGREFLASADERFRPVQCIVGPEGALYIVDMHRGVIQHKTYLTDYLRKQVVERGLERPLDMGRILRIVPDNTTIPTRVRLGSLTNARLVEQLSHQDMWRRTTAQRLLIERAATDLADRLRRLAHQGADPIARLHAHWTLDGLGIATIDDAHAALNDPDIDVAIAGLRISERWLSQPPASIASRGVVSTHVHAPLLDSALAHASHQNPRLRNQALLSLGASADPRAIQHLVDAIRTRPDDESLRAIAISGLYGRATDAISSLAADSHQIRGGRLWFIRDLFDADLTGPDYGARGRAINLIPALASERPELAAYLLGRLQLALRLNTDQPKPIELAAPPEPWIRLVASGSPLSYAARDTDQWLLWPGHGSTITSSGRVLTPQEIARFDVGRSLFDTTCSGCHGKAGTGAPGHAPALAGSSRVRGPTDTTIRILLHGLEGPLESDGQRFNSSMPAAPFKSDEEFAAVLTYIRRAWGNNAEPVSPEEIAQARAATSTRNRPWRIEELEPKP
ncbi:MAG: c-type cytochrome [Phycisphaeraceae bacterium]|nr:c-type cytochrome [Phycisphaeraceae bacterium]